MGYPLLQILDSDGNVAYDLNDGTTTYVSPEGFDLGTPELDDSYFSTGRMGARITSKAMRPCSMGWSQSVFTSSVEESRAEVGEIARLLRDGPTIKYQHDASAEVRYIDVLSLGSVPSWLRGSYGIPAQYVTITNRVEGMAISVVRQPGLRGEELDSDTNKLANSTLLAQGATTGRPMLWAWDSTSNISAEAIGSTVTGPLPGWKGAYQFAIATTSARNLQQSTAAASAANGQTWTLSFYAKASANSVVRVNPQIEYQSNVPTTLTTSTLSNQAVTTSWQRFSVTFTAANASTDRIRASIQFNNSAATSTTVSLAAVQLEQASSASLYRVGTETVYNDPASTAGMGLTVPVYVHGDTAPADSSLLLGAASSACEETWVSVFRPPSLATFLNDYGYLETASFPTNGTDTADITSATEADFSPGSGTVGTTITFATSAAVLARLSGDVMGVGTGIEALRGMTVKPVLRLRSTDAASVYTLRLAGASFGDLRTLTFSPGTTSTYYFDMGAFHVPEDAGVLNLLVYVSRSSGTGALRLDSLIFLPMDHLSKVDASINSTYQTLFDSSGTQEVTASNGTVYRSGTVRGPAFGGLEPGLNLVTVIPGSDVEAASGMLSPTITANLPLRYRGSPSFFS